MPTVRPSRRDRNFWLTLLAAGAAVGAAVCLVLIVGVNRLCPAVPW